MRPARFVLSLGLLTCGAAAQRTWTVDWLNRPGTDFTEIQPAVNAATSGDTIHVRDAGAPASGGHAYVCPIIDAKSLTLVGDGPTLSHIGNGTSTLVVRNLGPQQVVILTKFELGGIPLGQNRVVSFNNNRGAIFVDNVSWDTQNTFTTSSVILASDRVVLSHTTIRLLDTVIMVSDSNVMIQDCQLLRIPGLLGGLGTLTSERSKIWIGGTRVEGHSGFSSAPALMPKDCDLFVGPGTTIVGGSDQFGTFALADQPEAPNYPACLPNCQWTVPPSRLHTDPSATWLGNYLGNGLLHDVRDMPTLRTQLTGSTFTITQHGGPNSLAVLGAGPMLATAVALPLGLLCLDAAQSILWFGLLPASGDVVWTFAIPPSLPPGSWTPFQGVELTPSGAIHPTNLTVFGVW